MAFSFGATAPQTGFSFGAAKTTAPAFGAFQQTPAQNIGFGGFGAGTSTVVSTASGAFGGFGTASTGLGAGSTGFGISNPTGNAFGGIGTNLFANTQQQQQLQQQQQQQQQEEALKYSVTSPVIFGDERDQVILKWNQLQACWGAGTGFFSPQGASVTYNTENPFSLFKSIGYSCMPTNRNESGLVVLMFEKSPSEISSNQAHIVDAIHKLLGSKPNHIICVDGIKLFQENRCEVTIYVQDRQSTGVTNRVTSADLFNFLNQPSIKQQLANQLTVTNVYVKVSMDPQQLNFYLQHPPAGIDRRIWEQAKLDNPDPTTNLPVPIVGFQELLDRLKHQKQQTDLHQLKLSSLSTEVSDLKCKLQGVLMRSDELKRKQVILSHRLLKVIVKQEVLRKWGFPIQPEEEQLSGHLQSLHSELNTPNKIKDRLSDLLIQARQQSDHTSRPDVSLKLSPEASHDVKQHLTRQQEGLRHLVEVLRGGLTDLKTMGEDLALLSKARK